MAKVPVIEEVSFCIRFEGMGLLCITVKYQADRLVATSKIVMSKHSRWANGYRRHQRTHAITEIVSLVEKVFFCICFEGIGPLYTHTEYRGHRLVATQ
jgi:hypothetical protein